MRPVTLTEALVVCLALLSACSSNESDAPTATSDASSAASQSEAPIELVSLAERCSLDDEADTVPFVVTSSSGQELYAVEAGTGSRAVVLVHGSGRRGLCNWANELSWLADAGFRVIAFDGRCVGSSTCRKQENRPVDDVLSVVEASRARGSDEVVVVAASAGGPLAVQVAARAGSGVRATVALSPAGLDSEFDTSDAVASRNLDAAALAKVPILFAHAADDTSADPGRLADFYRVSKGSTLELLPPGAGHAQEVLYDSTRNGPSQFRETFLEFLRR